MQTAEIRLPRAKTGGLPPRLAPLRALLGRMVRDARVRTIAFAYLFAIYSYIQPVGYRTAYPKLTDRLAFARSFGENKAIRLLYGQPHQIATVSGYTAWRVGGVLAIAAALFGLLAAVRASRAEEDSGRMEIMLAGIAGRGTAAAAAVGTVAIGTLTLFCAQAAALLLAGLPAAGSFYLALATASIVPVCAGVGAVVCQLAPTRRTALQLGGAAIGVLFLLRALADSVEGLGWLRSLTPLGWAEQLRPFSGVQPLVLLAPVTATAALLALAMRLAKHRDIGTGILPARDSANPRLRLLCSPTTQALREATGTIAAWVITTGAFALLLGVVSKSISPADVSKSIQKEIAKIGSGAITTPSGYLAFIFIFLMLAVCVFACGQVALARQDEEQQRLEVLFSLPVSRQRWLLGRLLLAIGATAVICLFAALSAWAGAQAAGAHIAPMKLIAAGANCLPIAALFLGIAALAYAVVPRSSALIAYGLLTLAFLWNLVSSLLGGPKWLEDITPFAHVALIPTQSFRALDAAAMAAIGVIMAIAAIGLFGRRDLIDG
jgi:ABC-2 type transport system permease protein